MRVRILSVQKKDIKTRAGQDMTLRIVQGVNAAGDVFKFTLPKTHPDVTAGDHEVVAEPYIGFEADLSARAALRPVAGPAGK